jgi:hypothetical protein
MPAATASETSVAKSTANAVFMGNILVGEDVSLDSCFVEQSIYVICQIGGLPRYFGQYLDYFNQTFEFIEIVHRL